MTINKTLATAAKQLAHLDSPELEARLLLSHVLNKPQTWLFTHENERINAPMLSKYFTLITRRENHVPLAYLTNYKEFWGLGFYVDERVFIPRSDTEALVEKALSVIAESCRVPRGTAVISHQSLQGRGINPATTTELAIADIGTGCGCIAISIAHTLTKNAKLLEKTQSQALKTFKIYATDIDADSLAIAELNAREILGANHSISFLSGNLLSPLPQKVDLIVTNLPYFSEDEYEKSIPEIKHEPKQALIGGPEGNELINKLLAQAPQYLTPNGNVIYECDGGQIRTWPE
ncbi:peptide chain release factor N(5)-glutamine methyltransferase [Patescibacteria group bacterium]|nr:peptide chain release factor N(5)-glutamine methyltransferase [Patescibacteria group bacterium]MBU1867843.1 peptide chain release factor N(5)-glutamine methyltransferase [Patescibacteria group bacterium]